MNFLDIKNNIREWNMVRQDSPALQALLLEDAFFDFSLIMQQLGTLPKLHFYPAIIENKFVFYIIDTEKDKFSVYHEDPENFTNNIMVSELEVDKEDDPIEDPDANTRIDNWNNHKNEWIDANAPTNGLFLAFDYKSNISSPMGQVRGFFGLTGTPFNVDLVLLDENQSFFNTVKPVPPFDQDGDEYFILSASIG